MTPLQETLQATNTRILEYLQDKKTTTSWQLKLALHLSSSVIYICLGMLHEQGKILLEADELNYKVSLPTPDIQPQNQF